MKTVPNGINWIVWVEFESPAYSPMLFGRFEPVLKQPVCNDSFQKGILDPDPINFLAMVEVLGENGWSARPSLVRLAD